MEILKTKHFNIRPTAFKQWESDGKIKIIVKWGLGEYFAFSEKDILTGFESQAIAVPESYYESSAANETRIKSNTVEFG